MAGAAKIAPEHTVTLDGRQSEIPMRGTSQ